MRVAHAVMLALLAVSLAACNGKTSDVACRIEGPDELVPEKVRLVRLGMTRSELENVLGPADYSPNDGQFYFSTGGDCPLGDNDQMAACGVVAEFRDYSNDDDDVVTDSLQSCWWGAIGE